MSNEREACTVQKCWAEERSSILGRLEPKSARFHHLIQNSMHFKMYAMSLSGISQLTVLDCGGLWVTSGNWNTRKWNYRLRSDYQMHLCASLDLIMYFALTSKTWTEVTCPNAAERWRHSKFPAAMLSFFSKEKSVSQATLAPKIKPWDENTRNRLLSILLQLSPTKISELQPTSAHKVKLNVCYYHPMWWVSQATLSHTRPDSHREK